MSPSNCRRGMQSGQYSVVAEPPIDSRAWIHISTSLHRRRRIKSDSLTVMRRVARFASTRPAILNRLSWGAAPATVQDNVRQGRSVAVRTAPLPSFHIPHQAITAFKHILLLVVLDKNHISVNFTHVKFSGQLKYREGCARVTKGK